MSGTLYIVATPIGNLEDITLRAVRVLHEVDGIAAEDTRHTIKLLNHLGIKKPMLSLHEHNESERISLMMEKLDSNQSWALVSDAGTPGLCDPGSQLIAALRPKGYPCIPVPGCSALASALSVSGLLESRFHFEGFLPSKGTPRNIRLEALKSLEEPIFFYEAPHRFLSTVEDLFKTLGDRKITVFRELTKIHEQVYESTLSNILRSADTPRGEYVLLIHKSEEVKAISEDAIKEYLLRLMESGVPKKQAVLKTVQELHVRKNQVYSISLEL